MAELDRGLVGPGSIGARPPSTRAGAAAWIGIAANAASGRGRGRLAVARLADALDRLGLAIEVAWTPEARRDLVDRAAGGEAGPGGCRCLVAVGGDGTVAALVNDRPRAPIAVLPAGTENLFARHFGFGRHPELAAARIAAGRPGGLDLGSIGGRRFALMAGFGFDADVVSRHHAARVGRAGVVRPTRRSAYVEPVLRSSFGYRFPALGLVADVGAGAPIALEGTTAFVFNLPRYALGLPFAPLALGDDGWLDLVVFRDPGPFRALHYLWLVVRGLHLDRPGITHLRVRALTIEAEGSVPVQLDGDPAGALEPGAEPRRIEVLPRAIEVLMRGRRSALEPPAALRRALDRRIMGRSSPSLSEPPPKVTDHDPDPRIGRRHAPRGRDFALPGPDGRRWHGYGRWHGWHGWRDAAIRAGRAVEGPGRLDQRPVRDRPAPGRVGAHRVRPGLLPDQAREGQGRSSSSPATRSPTKWAASPGARGRS